MASLPKSGWSCSSSRGQGGLRSDGRGRRAARAGSMAVAGVDSADVAGVK